MLRRHNHGVNHDRLAVAPGPERLVALASTNMVGRFALASANMLGRFALASTRPSMGVVVPPPPVECVSVSVWGETSTDPKDL